MLTRRRTFQAIILLIFVFALGAALFSNLQSLQRNFLFADEAVYYMMTDSLAQDGDIEYTRSDLIRYYRVFNTDPKGIFLKKAKDGKLYYAKSWAYSLFTAPLVKLFQANGFLVFHSLLLGLILLMGFAYASSANLRQPECLGPYFDFHVPVRLGGGRVLPMAPSGLLQPVFGLCRALPLALQAHPRRFRNRGSRARKAA
jgi:hypothetical protein